MKAELARFSNLCFNSFVPTVTEDLILKAKGLPTDARIVHILPVKNGTFDYWEVLITSETFIDKSISELYNGPSLSLMF